MSYLTKRYSVVLDFWLRKCLEETSSFKSHSPNRWIPDLTQLVLLYSVIKEFWDETKNRANQFKIGSETNIATHISTENDALHGYAAVFGKELVFSSKQNNYYWKLKILHFVKTGWSLQFGIVKENEWKTYHLGACLQGYGISSHPKHICKLFIENTVRGSEILQRPLQPNDILEFKLDFNLNEMILVLNDKNYGNIIPENRQIIKCNYRFAISSITYGKNNQVQLLDFH